MEESWVQILTVLTGIVTPVGLGFGWLIKEIVKSSKDAVKELKETNEIREKKLEEEVELWRNRALQSGWKVNP